MPAFSLLWKRNFKNFTRDAMLRASTFLQRLMISVQNRAQFRRETTMPVMMLA